MSFSELATRQIQNPTNQGSLEGGLYGVSGTPGDGAYVEIWVHVGKTEVLRASFRTPGCPSSVASAGILCKLIEGRRISAVKALTVEDLESVVGTLPPGKEHYLTMSILALQSAIQEVL